VRPVLHEEVECGGRDRRGRGAPDEVDAVLVAGNGDELGVRREAAWASAGVSCAEYGSFVETANNVGTRSFRAAGRTSVPRR
jgi:hypothetical protein